MRARFIPMALVALVLTACSEAPTDIPAPVDARVHAPLANHVPGTPVLNPVNGHYYMFVQANLTWAQAKAAAEAATHMGVQGHLATVTSANENAFVASLINHTGVGWVWLGGLQANTCEGTASAGWSWVTGETWSYTNFAGGEPNDWQGNCESLIVIYGPAGGTLGTWNDVGNGHSVYGTPSESYLVEFDVPLDADGDGVADGADNCPAVYNPNQSDVDGDAFGDVCDNLYVSGTHVTTWNAIPASGPFAGFHDDGISRLCVTNPAVGLDAAWTNPKAAIAGGPATFEGWSGFQAQWINAWPSIDASHISPGGIYNGAQYGSGYGTSSQTSLPGKNWTRYQTKVSGDGSFVLNLHADNCSWIYLSDEDGNNPQLVGTQLNSNPGAYGVVLDGIHTLDFIIYDGGGQAGGKYRLNATTNPPPPLVVDNTPPVVAPTVTGTLGDNGWYTSDVNVSWTVTDNESTASTTGCDAQTVTTDTNGVTFTCTATSDGGTASASVTVKRDATAPTVSATLSGTLFAGWYNTDVGVAWTTADNLSGVAATSCANNTVTTDGTGLSQSCTATDDAGNVGSGSTGTFKRDATDPVVTYTGNAGSYDVADAVSITCSATDNLSGVAVHDCADLVGDAYTFGVGTTSFSAAAQDNAGNDGSASGSFTVTASHDGLCTLVQRFVSHNGVANSLCAKLRAAAKAKNDKTHDNVMEAFINEVEAQSGKKIDAADAAVLVTIARALIG